MSDVCVCVCVCVCLYQHLHLDVYRHTVRVYTTNKSVISHNMTKYTKIFTFICGYLQVCMINANMLGKLHILTLPLPPSLLLPPPPSLHLPPSVPPSHLPSSLPPSLPPSASLPVQEIQQLRVEIDAQAEVISIMEEAVKENERRHESCTDQEKQL